MEGEGCKQTQRRGCANKTQWSGMPKNLKPNELKLSTDRTWDDISMMRN